jgi:CRP/FNR family cyclic AMP-dependent transcriptional regulator
MHTLFDCTTSTAPYVELATRVRERIVQAVDALEQHVVIPAGASVDAKWGGRPAVFLIEEGCLHIPSPKGAMIVYEEGDLVGVHASLRYPVSIEAPDFAAVVSVYSAESLLHKVAESGELFALWHEFLCAASMMYVSLLSERVHVEPDPIPRIRVFHPGEEILRQGERGHTVLTMVEGAARVEVDGVAVGQVHKDEIFGAIAAITGSDRSASVVAESDCLVMELEAAKFQALLQTHPTLIARLIQDMARAIKSLNRNLVDFSQPSL